MNNLVDFKRWLAINTAYSPKTISNIVSRVKRADKMLPIFNDDVYQFHLEKNEMFMQLSCSVRSQVKKAVTLYNEFLNGTINFSKVPKCMHVLSLFANIGVAEALFDKKKFEVVIANELDRRRANLYSEIYSNTKMISGDITDSDIYRDVINASKKIGIDIIMATPPCQGMSTAGQQNKNDIRNNLIVPVINAVKDIEPSYVFIENVPLLFNTSIIYENKAILIHDLIERELGDRYNFRKYVINTKNYSVPQNRERAIILLTKKNMNLKEWLLPAIDDKIVTLDDAIGHLPILDPYVTDVSEEELKQMFPKYSERKSKALSISKWHNPPHHIKRQIIAMQHTPTGCTAFDNEKYFPVKADGMPVKGYRNTYKRQNWNTEAYTVTMDNRKISSQNNVHPGRKEYIDEEGNTIYSDARALTLYETMLIMSLPENWNIPDNISEAFIRRVIGEGIPPVFVKKVFDNII